MLLNARSGTKDPGISLSIGDRELDSLISLKLTEQRNPIAGVRTRENENQTNLNF
jgi:hypothetical protein